MSCRDHQAGSRGLAGRSRILDLMDDLPRGLNGPPIDFAAYHFDPHTLLAVLLLILAIVILAVTAVIQDRKPDRK